jgi:NAD(P)-dependent dehydrogenase (short-subunit alcohol dehydrogenase family)
MTTERLPEFASGAALVVGGTGGIGSAICRALLAAGSDLIIGYRANHDAANALSAEAQVMGREALALSIDLLDTQSIEAAVAEAIERFGHLHSIVYAAGPSLEYLYINEISSTEWARVINGDVNGCFNLIEATLPHLRRQGAGSFLAVTTAAVDHAPPRDILSAAPKAAIEMLIKGIAREEGRNGIRANCVRPGLIAAGLGLSTMHDHTQDYVDRMAKAVPLKRAGKAEEVADAALFLLSDRARYITGVSIPVAGGLQLV